MKRAIVVFGQSQKGVKNGLIALKSIPEVLDNLGQKTEGHGLVIAIETILSLRPLFFFRVTQEGFNVEEYVAGLGHLESSNAKVLAIALPGVGDPEIIGRARTACLKTNSYLLISEGDLFDLSGCRSISS